MSFYMDSTEVPSVVGTVTDLPKKQISVLSGLTGDIRVFTTKAS